MHFKTLSIIKHPLEDCWSLYRDEFPRIGEQVDDLEYIKLLNREENGNGQVFTEYEWKANPPLPAKIKDMISSEMLTWVDQSTWEEGPHLCHWAIVTRYFGERLDCHGRTIFSEAMGGRGCRLTFEGQLEWTRLLSSEAMLIRMVEPFLKQLVLQNFRKVSKVAESLL